MHVDVQWRPDLELATIDYKAAVIDSDERFEQWIAKVIPPLRGIFAQVGHPFPLVVNIDELEISPQFSARYREELVDTVNAWCDPIARHGTASNVRVIVSLEAMRGAYQANIFSDFEQAVKFARGEQAQAVQPEGDQA